MTNHEEFALTWHLSCWPEHFSYDEVLQALKDSQKDGIYPNTEYESMWLEHIAASIENMVSMTKEYFKEQQ